MSCGHEEKRINSPLIEIGDFKIEASNLKGNYVDLKIMSHQKGFAYAKLTSSINYDDIRVVLSDTITLKHVITTMKLQLFQFKQDDGIALKSAACYTINEHLQFHMNIHVCK